MHPNICLQSYVPLRRLYVCKLRVNARVSIFVFTHACMCVWMCVRARCKRASKINNPTVSEVGAPKKKKKSKSQDYGNFRGRNSSVCFQASFTPSEVRSIKHTHAHKHTHADKRVVSVTPVNRVSINLIVPT